MTIQSSSMDSQSADLQYREAARQIQEGAWIGAMQTLQNLLEEHPEQESEILPLLEHVQMKAKLEGKAVRGRSQLELLLLNRKKITSFVIAILMLFLAGAGWFVYQNWLSPARQQQIQLAEMHELLARAREAMEQADYAGATQFYEQVLNQNDTNLEAQQGLAEAQHQMELANTYADALQAQEQGDLEQALSLFEQIQAQESDYRDVDSRIASISTAERLDEMYAQAEDFYAQKQWANAIPLYKNIRQKNIDYQATKVEEHLYDSYSQLATALSNTSGLSPVEIDTAAKLFDQAVSLRPRDRFARSQEQLLSQYLQADQLLGNRRYSDAIGLLSPIYEVTPHLLGGDAVQALYEARLGHGKELEQAGNLWAALVQYSAASDLPVDNVDEAQLRARTLGLALTPTPTPTPTVTPTPTPDPVKELAKVIPPTPSPLEQLQGWIAYRSDRPGSPTGLWAMSPDGGQQIPVSDSTQLYSHLQEQAKWTSNNQRRIWVEDDGSGASVAIYMWRYDVPSYWQEARVELLNNSAINYQPVLSPDDQHIAFTSQRSSGSRTQNYGDEIFIFHFAEINSFGHALGHRLTQNDWEWDKHPTFSADGQTIAFWSNRDTGRAQIWAMKIDGTDQRNLSNNEWNDWDPVFIVPRREIPTIGEQEGSPNFGLPLFDPEKYDAGQ